MKNGVMAALAVVVVAMAYALVNDLFDGLTFTRSARSWAGFIIGLILFGLAGLLVDGSLEWAVSAREPWDDGPRRSVRVAVAVAILVIVVAIILAWNKYCG